jgi:23S rRNA (cytidine1920-2'-O)/16S rRNA (cytidine1409-2'-O)-methyltransferase
MAMRLDISVSERYHFTRNKSQSFIKDGLISVNGKIITKPSFEVNELDTTHLTEDKKTHWVSRSAGKLDGFIEELRMKDYDLKITGTSCLDVGSSTGWFTQVLLERWATHVHAVDVGTDQLHSTIKSDPRVTSYEKMDIREFADLRWVDLQIWESQKTNQPKNQSANYDLIVCDASFISLEEILPYILSLANKQTHIILLWKPQFEVGRENLRKTWVPKDEKIVTKIQKGWEEFVKNSNCEILHQEKSTVVGEAGNQEWLYLIRKYKKTLTSAKK